MISPVESSVVPSCCSALAWSPDGELAVAGGDQVYILTPNIETAASVPQGKEQWDTTRIRVSVFTTAEWPPIYPQNRDDFSLAAEQSTSTVKALAWSPPGLARFRRSVLAVLTSGLVLSLWEPMGLKRQWTRIGIVNHALYPDPSNPTPQKGMELRRVNIRSFQWCPSIKTPSASTGPAPRPDPENRWGIHLLMVATDASELALMRVRRSTAESPSGHYQIEKMTVHPLGTEDGQYPAVQSGSLLHARLQIQARILHVSCGPWLTSSKPTKVGAHSVCAIIAAVFGSRLQLLKLAVEARHASDLSGAAQYKITAEIGEHTVAKSAPKWSHHHVKGPLEWLYTDKSEVIALAVGIPGGLLTISIPRSAYEGKGKRDYVQALEWPLFEPITTTDEFPKRHSDPITAMTTSPDEQHDTCILHLGTAGGVSAAIRLEQLDTKDRPQLPAWGKLVEDHLEQYDLNRDLGGQSVARVWGLASHRDVNAVIFSRHPTDMVEYRVASDEKTIIAFAASDAERDVDMQTLFAPHYGNQELRSVQEHREAVTTSLLFGSETAVENEDSQKLIYAAACCAIVDGHGESIRRQARRVFERLAALTGVDLREEISKCGTDHPTISEKSTDQLNGSGGSMFERCEVCEAGIIWFAATEAQCANGHLFARCGLTFLTIQEPGISKYCSLCRTEYIDEEVVASPHDGHLSQIFRSLCETFDTCLYCGGKFQPHV